MKIDVTPIIEQADDWHRTVIDARELEALYVVRLANGKDYTTEWDKKGLTEFLPKRTVSEMLHEWEEGIKRRYAEAVEALRTGLHPTFTVVRHIMYKGTTITGEPYEAKTGKTEIVPQQLGKYGKENFKRIKKDLKEEFGTLSFVKIV